MDPDIVRALLVVCVYALPVLLVFSFGYIKPVLVNFSTLRQPKRDMVWVAFAVRGSWTPCCNGCANCIPLPSHN